jgi:hypothetical protein
MAKFYFHFRQYSALTHDEQGSEFDSVEDAYLSAFRAAQEMWHELLLERQDPRSCSFEVVDADGSLLFVLPFMEVLDACTGSKSRKQGSYVDAFLAALNNQRHAHRLHREVSAQVDAARSSVRQSLNLLAQLRKLE